jgi:hypothetical protein
MIIDHHHSQSTSPIQNILTNKSYTILMALFVIWLILKLNHLLKPNSCKFSGKKLSMIQTLTQMSKTSEIEI